MLHDFRTVAEAVKVTVKDMNSKDPNWKWKATANKAEIKIYWSYLEYKGTTPPFIITDGTAAKNEVEEGYEGEFIVLRDEHGHYMDGKLIGTERWADGTLEQSVVSLLRYLQARVNHTY